MCQETVQQLFILAFLLSFAEARQNFKPTGGKHKQFISANDLCGFRFLQILFERIPYLVPDSSGTARSKSQGWAKWVEASENAKLRNQVTCKSHIVFNKGYPKGPRSTLIARFTRNPKSDTSKLAIMQNDWLPGYVS